MWKPDPEFVEESIEGYSEELLVTATLVMSLFGIAVALFLGENPALAFVGMVGGITVGFLSWFMLGTIGLGWARRNQEQEFVEKEVRGEELVERYKEYPSCGNYIVTTFCDLYSPEGTDDIRVVFDMPGYEYEIDYEFPYDWDEDSSGIVEVMKKRGIDKYEFNELIGEPVLVKTVDGSSTEFDVYNVRHPEERIRDLHEANELDEEDVDVEEIQRKFDFRLPWNASEEETEVEDTEIVAEEGAAYKYVDSVR